MTRWIWFQAISGASVLRQGGGFAKRRKHGLKNQIKVESPLATSAPCARVLLLILILKLNHRLSNDSNAMFNYLIIDYYRL